jgi:hypothetical protein
VSLFDPADALKELKWLQDHPEFEERPASMLEFLGADYLNIESKVRAGVKQELLTLFGTETNPQRIANFRWGMFTGAIGIGKTTMASIILPYMCHWVLCLKDPQDYYDLLPGSRIAFMQMSTSEDQAVETVFGDIKARIENSKWFQDNYPYDPKFSKQIRFSQKDIWILPGNSAETTFEGYNILGGILDEADSHKKTKDKDYAEVGYTTINSRIDSRFQDRGFLLVIGQMKSASGFAHKTFGQMSRNPEAHVVRMTIWESMGWDKYLKKDGSGERDSFWYDKIRKEIVPTGAAEFIKDESTNLIEVPMVYIENFKNEPEKALRDLAGIPPASGDPFISLTYKIDDCQVKWDERYPGVGSPVDTNPTRPQFADWFTATTPLKRALHLDIAYSDKGDAAGLAMGHVSHLVNLDGEEKPYIVIDFLMRWKASPGQEIMISDLRRTIFDLKDEYGFRLRTVSMDGFQSTDTRQQLQKRRFSVDYLSVDKSKLPYEDLRDAIYEGRLEFPRYMTYLTQGSTEVVNIAYKELSELEDLEKKVDHPANGSKDVADCLAGVVNTLMGDRMYRRGVRSHQLTDEPSDSEDEVSGISSGSRKDRFGAGGLVAPIPPTTFAGQDDDFSFQVPPSLMPGR